MRGIEECGLTELDEREMESVDGGLTALDPVRQLINWVMGNEPVQEPQSCFG